MSKENNDNNEIVVEVEDVETTKPEKEKVKKQAEKSKKSVEPARRSKRSPIKWFREARAEFKKVTWPTPKQVLKNTSVVLTMLVIAGLSVWGLDKLLIFAFRVILGGEGES